MRHRDAFFPDPRAAPPGPVDAVQDLLLPVGQRQLAPAGRVRGRLWRLVLRLIVLCLIVLCLIVLGVLTERLVDPAVAHGRPAWAASATRVRFIRPKL